jgi:lysyl-tRNA synthetase class I
MDNEKVHKEIVALVQCLKSEKVFAEESLKEAIKKIESLSLENEKLIKEIKLINKPVGFMIFCKKCGERTDEIFAHRSDEVVIRCKCGNEVTLD